MYTAIITAHGNKAQAVSFVNRLKEHTLPPSEIFVFYSGFSIDNDWIRCENLNDWGHTKRRQGLEVATQPYLVFMNADDDYDKDFASELLKHDEDFIYCDFTSHKTSVKNTGLHCGQITSGCYLVKTDIAKEVGYNHDEYTADWLFIKDLLDHGVTTRHVKSNLYTHR